MAAKLGTAAHKLLEICVLGDIEDVSTYAGLFIGVPKQDGEAELLYSDTGSEETVEEFDIFPVDEKMVDGVQLAIDTLVEWRGKMDKPRLLTETFLDMSWLDPRLGGTADLQLIEFFGWAHIFDYKNGYIFVDHRDNEQVLIYGLGVMHENPDVEGIRITIIQPNAPHDEGLVRTVSYTREEIDAFEVTVREAAAATALPNARRRPGDWCRYCPAAGTRCPEFDQQVMEETKLDFADDPEDIELEIPTTTYELRQRAKFIPILDIWVKNVKKAIFAETMAGEGAALGKKVVRGRANRMFPDEKALVKRVSDEGLEVNLYGEPKIMSPAQVEKLGDGKDERKLFKKIVSELAIKPEGKLAIADLDDPRKAVDVSKLAADDFRDVEEESDDDFD